MKRKLCSVLLALCMVLTLLPVSALADETDTNTEAVAAVGETEYNSLADAIEAAGNDGTVTLLADVTMDTTLTLNKNLTLDLNGHEISNGSGLKTSDYLVKIPYGAAVSIIGNKENSSIKDTRDNVKGTITAICVFGDLTIDGEGLTISRGLNGIAIKVDESGADKLGKLTVNGGKISSTQAIQDWGNCTINGGTFIGEVGSHAYSNVAGSLTINGGVFNGAVYSGQLKYNGSWPTASAKTTITNGTINGVVAEYYDDGTHGLQPVDRSDITTGTVECETSVSGGSFSDLSALDYLASGANVTVKLAENTTKDVTIPSGAIVTLDLNGKTLTNAGDHTITNNGNLTVTGNGTVDNVTHQRAAIKNNVGGTVTVENGTFTRSAEASTSDTDHGNNSYYVIDNQGTMTINNGTFKFSDTNNGKYSSLIHNGWYDGGKNTTRATATMVINGGDFTQAQGGKNTVKNDDYGDLTINGGSFTQPVDNYFCIFSYNVAKITNGNINGHVGVYGVPNSEADKGQLTISGTPTITKNIYAYAGSTVAISGGTVLGTLNKADSGSLSLTGGTYSSDPTAYVADGYIARVNSDGTFTVVAKTGLKNGTYTTSPEGGLASGYSYYQDGDYYTVYRPAAPSTSTSTTTKNPDGSTTTTTTDKATGTVTETTKNTDGSTTTTETKKDGSVTETNKTANGSVGTIKSDANGNSEISASISAADVNDAAKKNEPVAAPVSVAPAASSASAPVIKLSVPASAGEVSVVIPVTNAQQGTVAVKVNPNGTEEIIKTSVVTENGVVLGVEGNAQIKIVNNDKDFVDTVGHWAESDVDFVSARELFTGTAPQTFSPEADMTRGMVVTVLARLAGESTDGGANWYDKGCEWAVANGVSDGSNPNGSITREQLAAMLYRYFGSPAVSGSLNFADASSVSEYAHDAMLWCVNNGIINGMDGLLNPQGQATRAQVSAMFARYIRLMATK